MSLPYVDINQAIKADGLRLIVVQGMPSAWGIAVRGMMEYKSLDFTLGPQKPMGENAELLAWSGTNSGPVVAWNDEKPINRWDDILVLLERLAPDKPLVPENAAERMQLFGIGREICGELGLGWNRRLDMMRPADDASWAICIRGEIWLPRRGRETCQSASHRLHDRTRRDTQSAESPRERLHYRTIRYGRRFLLGHVQ